MKRLKLDNVYESSVPPSDIKVLWADKDERTGDIRAIHRYRNGKWEPYLVSVDYLERDPDDGDLTGPPDLEKSPQVQTNKITGPTLE